MKLNQLQKTPYKFPDITIETCPECKGKLFECYNWPLNIPYMECTNEGCIWDNFEYPTANEEIIYN